MANNHGDFIWYELMTSDAYAAQNFYGALLDWTFQDGGQKNADYRVISAKDESVGGILPITDEMTTNGAQPCWMGYVNVDDVDASVKSIKQAGGRIRLAPWDIPEVGRVAFVTDPQGAMFYVMKPAPPPDQPDRTSTAFAATEPIVGHCAWNELATTDQDAVVKFYTDHFGWRQEGEMDMGPMGKYQFLHHGPGMIGAVMAKPDEMPISSWTYYFRVPDIDAAVETIKAKGGQITLPPTEIPGGEFQVNGIDPQGAAFALVGLKVSA